MDFEYCTELTKLGLKAVIAQPAELRTAFEKHSDRFQTWFSNMCMFSQPFFPCFPVLNITSDLGKVLMSISNLFKGRLSNVFSWDGFWHLCLPLLLVLFVDVHKSPPPPRPTAAFFHLSSIDFCAFLAELEIKRAVLIIKIQVIVAMAS